MNWRAFWAGMFDLWPSPQLSIEEALRKDWEAVGGDRSGQCYWQGHVHKARRLGSCFATRNEAAWSASD